jgi:hypothetical protein
MKQVAALWGLVLLLTMGCGSGQMQDSGDGNGLSAPAMVERVPHEHEPTPKEDSLEAEFDKQDSLAKVEFMLLKKTGEFSAVFESIGWTTADSLEGNAIHQVGWANDSLEVRVTSEQNCCLGLGVNAVRESDSLFIFLYHWGHSPCKCETTFALQWKGHVRKYGGVKHVMFPKFGSPTGWEELPWSLHNQKAPSSSSK